MDDLTKTGLKFIKSNTDRLTSFALAKITNGSEENDWYGFDMTTLRESNELSNISNTIDVNIWLDKNKWRATAYPMQVNRIDEIQVNTNKFVELF